MSGQADASAAWQNLGEAIGNAFFYLHIHMLIVAAVLVLLAVLAVVYIRKRKRSKPIGNEKSFVLLRVCIIVTVGVLVLLIAPVLIGALL